MAEKSTIARPYAQAVFDLANKQGDLAGWSDMLQLLTLVAQDENMNGLIGNPRVGKDRLTDLFIDVCGDKLNDSGKNFIKVLSQNDRMELIPEITAIYEVYRAEAEKVIQAEIISAFEVSEEQKQSIAAALTKRLGREVSVECTVDKSLVGGAVIRAGDIVIDGSVTGQLEKLASVLSH
ncbi:MAG: F0F1 ATP synthase subunit delta [Gammaproteobacteria bacterium]